MNASDNELLREFARDGSEAAFAELVRRYLDLVFSAALRQLDSDVHAARDVSQIVFTDLARKAATLGRHTALTGWLYSSTRFEAIQYRRTEARRIARETAAHAMSQTLAATAEPDWNRLQPVLDEAMHDLPEDDRLAVLMRYFEKRPLAEIGTRLGLSENTARMRVDRALDKLHTALKKRGITSTAAALGTLLGGNAIASVPADLAEHVTRNATAAWQRKRPALARGPGWLIPVTVALLLGIGGLMWVNRQGWLGSKNNDDATQPIANASSSEADSGSPTNRLTDSLITDHSLTNASDSPAEGEPWTGPELRLKIVTKDTGQPVPGVSVQSDNRFGASAADIARRGFRDTRYDTVTSRAGEARVRYLPDVEQLEVSTAVDGFASMILHWRPQKGAPVPASYTLRLDRTVPIGGRVLDADGNPATNTSVRVIATADLNDTVVERYASGLDAKVGADGRWRTDRLAEPLIPRVSVSVWSEEYPSSSVSVQDYPAILPQLRNQTHVIQLEKGLSVEGEVIDDSGQLVAGALVTLTGGTDRHTKTSDAGAFRFSGLTTQTYLVGVAAPGYAPTKTHITVTENMAPVRIAVGTGVPLRIRLVDGRGMPVTNAMANRLGALGGLGTRLGMVDERHPDANGRLHWTNSSPGINRIEIEAESYIRENAVSVVADGEEHPVKLMRAPVIRGRVTDADSGRPVAAFNLALGSASRDELNQTTNIDVSGAGWFRPYFTNGAYLYEMSRRIASVDPGGDEFMVRFEAKGYRPRVSRAISYEEGEVTLDVELEPASEIDVTVVDPSGRPAASALLGLAKTGSRFFLKGVDLGFLSGGTPGVVRSADGAGKLMLSQEPDVVRVLAVHPSGYVETTIAALANDPVLRLQAWGRIEGRYASTHDSLERRVEVMPQEFDPVVTYGFSTTAAASGRFVFPQVPPGDLVVWQRNNFGRSDPLLTAPVRSTEVTVEPGKTADVTLGGAYRVTGRVVWPEGMPRPRFSYWRGTLGVPVPEIPSDLSGDETAIRRWAMQPDIRLRFRHAEQVPVFSKKDGVFAAEAVNPGTYRLQMSLYGRMRDGQPEMRFCTVDHEVIVPEQPGTGDIDIGEIQATAVSP